MAKFPALPLSVEEESKTRGQRIGRPPISQLEKVGVLFSFSLPSFSLPPAENHFEAILEMVAQLEKMGVLFYLLEKSGCPFLCHECWMSRIGSDGFYQIIRSLMPVLLDTVVTRPTGKARNRQYDKRFCSAIRVVKTQGILEPSRPMRHLID